MFTRDYRYKIKALRRIERASQLKKFACLSFKANVIKFKTKLEQFNYQLKAILSKRIGTAFSVMKNHGLGVVGSNSKLHKLKQLKNKIKTQAIKIESKLSKSQSTKNKALIDQFGSEKVSNLFSKKRGSMIENTLGIINKHSDVHENSIEKENELLELKLMATEEYIVNFIKETSEQIDNLELDKLKR